MTLKNRTALVTGSTQGIGLAIAQALAQEGANIVLHGIEEAGQGEAISADLATRFGVQAAYVRANLANAEEAEQLVAVASQVLGAPDILVNNAGIQYTCGIESFPAERWDAILAAKHGLVGLSKGVALETATQGIAVNCICPGWTDTAIIQPQIDLRAAKFGGDRDAGIRDLLSEKQPNQTLLAPQRIGEIVAFLCSESAAGITGVALPVDGGWTAQ